LINKIKGVWIHNKELGFLQNRDCIFTRAIRFWNNISSVAKRRLARLRAARVSMLILQLLAKIAADVQRNVS